MNPKDIGKMCLQNLLRRKARTFLTVLGVIIGCCSIVIMVSIGIGIKDSQEKMLQNMGDLSVVTVNATGSGKQATKLDSKAISSIKALEDVEAVTPKLTMNNVQYRVLAGKDKRYVGDSLTLVGMDMDSVNALGFKVLEGKLPKKGSKESLIGQHMEFNFADSLRPEGRNMVGRYDFSMEDMGSEGGKPEEKKAYFDAQKLPLTLEIELENEKKVSFPLPVSGRVKEDFAKGFESSEGILVPLKYLEEILRSSGAMKGKKVEYQTLLVKVKNIDKVKEVEGAIKALGLQTSSMDSIREPLEQEGKKLQLMLGGLGGVSLLVAAIGITNTMIMSISERTKEIGIMKALGCYVHDIRKVFLAEAGAIGLIGGILGSIISLTLSFVINTAVGGAGGFMEEMPGVQGLRISVIPLWLILFAIVFSVVIGLVSGYYPANRAVKISALEAIRNE